jgi:putative transposase
VGQSEKRCKTMLCSLLGYSRQGYYRQVRRAEREALESELVIQEVQRHRQGQPKIGTRKLLEVMAVFMLTAGIVLGRDGFFDLLREHGLLVRKRKSRKPRTTYSCFWKHKYPNLAKDFIPTGPNQLWVSDITYIRIGKGFGYLSLVTDAYSRKIVGFCLRRDLTARGCIAALRMALKDNSEREGLIHHSDRGMQYYSSGYLKLLGPGIRVSMTENSDPLENAIAERVNGILKGELLKERFDSFSEAADSVAIAISTYNHLRPHSSVDMLMPAVAHTLSGPLKRRWKNYYSINKQKEVLAMT